MSFKPFRKLRLVADADVDEKHINQVQDNIASALGQLLGKDALDVSLLKNVKLVVGLNKVSHTLGRALQGWHVVRTHGSFPWVYDVQDTNLSPHLTLNLMATTAVTVDLLVF